MSHPFFDVSEYPWNRPEATRLHQALTIGIDSAMRIDLLYKQCAPDLPPLLLQAPLDEIWREALTKLTVAGALTKLCEIVLKTTSLKQIHTVVLEIMAAQEIALDNNLNSAAERDEFLEILYREIDKDHTLVRKMAADYAVRIKEYNLSFASISGSTKRTNNNWKGIIETLVQHARTHNRLEELYAVCVTWLHHPEQTIFHFIKQQSEVAQTNKLPQYPPIIGRRQQMAEIIQGLALRKPFINIYGQRGVGKTHVVRELVDLCGVKHKSGLRIPFKYVVWIDINDVTNRSIVIKEIASVLGQKTTVQSDIRREKDRLQQWLCENRTLIIVDNFENIQKEDDDLKNWLLSITRNTRSNIIIISIKRISSADWKREIKGLSKEETQRLIHMLSRQDNTLIDLIDNEAANVERLVEETCGNPFALERCMGILAQHDQSITNLIQDISNFRQDIDAIHKYLFRKSWDQMDKADQKLLVAMIRFSRELTKSALREVSGLSDNQFDVSLTKLLKNGMLREIGSERYRFHSSIMGEVEQRITNMVKDLNTELQDYKEACRERRANYYIRLVRRIEIHTIPERYWNAAVNEKMQEIDTEIKNIRKVLQWAENFNRYDIILHLMLDLVHYMDHRSSHSDRITYAKLAAPAANQEASNTNDPMKKQEYLKFEALFRIDALGWTYIETGHLDEAQREIENGLRIVKDMKTNPKARQDIINLQALGYAWQARVLMEQIRNSKPTSARPRGRARTSKIYKLINIISQLDCEPVYKYRVAMAEGDIHFYEKHYEQALKCYTVMKEMSEITSEDVDLYQVIPRLALAELALENIDTANALFERLSAHYIETTFQLYAKYGQGLVQYAQGQATKDWELIWNGHSSAEEAKNMLDSRVHDSILFKLMNQYFNELGT